MTNIHDIDFLRILFGRFCHRRASTRDDLHALGRLHINVHNVPNGSLTVSVCDAEGRVLDVGYWPGSPALAWGRWALCINDGIADADPRRLGRLVRTFLLRQGINPTCRFSTRKGVA